MRNHERNENGRFDARKARSWDAPFHEIEYFAEEDGGNITLTEAPASARLLNGQPLGSRFALEQKCADMRGRLAAAPASLYSDVNTPEAKLDQIAAILIGSCGAAYVTVVVRLNPTPDKH